MGTTDIKECAVNEPEIRCVLYSHYFFFFMKTYWLKDSGIEQTILTKLNYNT